MTSQGRRWTGFFSGLIIAGLVAGCGGQDPAFTVEPQIRTDPDGPAPLTAELSFAATAGADTVVTIGEGPQAVHYRMGRLLEGTASLPLIGLAAGRSTPVTITLSLEGRSLTHSLLVDAPPPPADPAEFPNIEVRHADLDRMEPGWRLLNPRRRLPRETAMGTADERAFGRSFGMLLMIDAAGTPVWMHRTASRVSDFDLLPDGRILYMTQDHRIFETDLLGQDLAAWYAAPEVHDEVRGTRIDALGVHHDVERIDEETLAVLAPVHRVVDGYLPDLFPSFPQGPIGVMGDEVLFVGRDGAITWRWNVFDHLDISRAGYETNLEYWGRRGFPDTVDWSHANALIVSEDASTVLVNFRYLSALVKIDRASGEIIWIFGEPSGWPEHLQDRLIRLEGDARWFWHQHAPQITSRGTILFFDNGNYRARPPEPPAPITDTWSRAVEYEIDEETLTAREIWSSETAGDPRVVAIAMGGVDALPVTGNVLVGFGALLDTERLSEIDWDTRFRIGQWTRATEYTRTTPSERVWDAELTARPGTEAGWTIFGIDHVDPAIVERFVRSKARGFAQDG
ncbi:MAG: aryl-sulfate sulfotransferase [Alphaproteobacteria bacterium]|nr:aryl-sulfate sulfotransferase [Alphaproteobacteria bacterium]